MPSLDTIRLELGLGGDSYYDQVIASAPVGFWPLSEQLAGTGARDRSGNARHGTYTGGITFGGMSPFPHGGPAITPNGSTGYVSMGDVTAFEFTGAFSVECLFKTSSVDAVDGLITKSRNYRGWQLYLSSGSLRFSAYTVADAVVFDIITTQTYNDGSWHHVVATWDGTTGANKVIIYVDGVSVKTGTAVAGTPDQNAGRCLLGAQDDASGNATSFLNGWLAGVALYSSALSSSTITAQYTATLWTDISDVDGASGVEWSYGIPGNSPLDRLAHSGQLEFVLQNYANAAGRPQGYYAPNNANVRSGFTHGIPVRIRLTQSTDRVKFWGKVYRIDPEPGQYRSKLVPCTAYDFMYTLADTDVREISPQIDQSEDDLIRVVLDALPATVQPMAVSLDDGLDVYPVAFDDIRGGVKAPTALIKPIMSSWGKAFTKGDGTFCYRNRQAQSLQSSRLTITNTMSGLVVPSTRTNVYNHVRVTSHPKTFGATATEVLYSLPQPVQFAAGETKELWGNYSDPNDRQTSIGGKDFTAPVSGTDWIANANEDGSGANRTADYTVTASFFITTVLLTVTNTAGSSSWLRTLQGRGRGIYDLGPFTQESSGDRTDRPIAIDLPYQDDANVALALADFIRSEYESLENQVDQVEINPQESSDFMTAALDREPGDLLDVTETVTGLDGVGTMIYHVEQRITKAKWLENTWQTAPTLAGSPWILGQVGRSELGTTTILAAA